MNGARPDLAAIVDEVRAVYSDLDRRPIQRRCELRTECCQFKLTGRKPLLTRGEALVAANALRAAGKTSIPVRRDGACPLRRERDGRCLIYEARPFGCRTHFCRAAGGPYDRAAVLDLIRRLEDIDARLAADGARAIEGALADALVELEGLRPPSLRTLRALPAKE